MKNIVIIATGGTIAGSGEAGRTTEYRAGTVAVADILKSVPQLGKLANIEMISLMSVDSNEMDEQKWLQLRKVINQQAARDDVDGIVVTHGTDTIEETAYFLNLTVNTAKPVVLTGAMRPATATSADGPFNIYRAVALAADDQTYDCGVVCLFSSTIYSARDIAKINNYKIDAFSSLNDHAALGYMRDAEVFITSRPVSKHTIHSKFSQLEYSALPKVGVAVYYAGAPVEVLERLGQDCDGLVVIGTGSGNYSQAWRQKLDAMAEQGVVIVRSSRVSNSIVFDEPIFDPHDHFIGLNTLTSYKARILLMLCLTQTNDIAEIRQTFFKY